MYANIISDAKARNGKIDCWQALLSFVVSIARISAKEKVFDFWDASLFIIVIIVEGVKTWSRKK